MLTKTLKRCFSVNPWKSVLRSESQNTTWSFKDLEFHSDAFSTGLQEQGFKRGDRLVTWFDDAHVNESVTAQIGCLKAGITVVPITTANSSEFFSALKNKNVRGAIFSPNGRVEGNLKKSEAILKKFGELNDHYLGNSLSLNDLPNLKVLVQTGFYNIPGVLKMRDVMLYGNKNFLNFDVHGMDNLNEGTFDVYDTAKGPISLEEVEEVFDYSEKNKDKTFVVVEGINTPKVFIKSALASYFGGNLTVCIPNINDSQQVISQIENPVIVHGDRTPKEYLELLQQRGVKEFALAN